MPFAASRTHRWLTASIIAWLLAAAAYTTLRLIFARAPEIHVRWASSVDPAARAELERRLALSGGTLDSGQTWVYFLRLPTEENIRALVLSPAVEDTHNIDRRLFRVSATAPRHGPYVTTGAQWIPPALQALAMVLALAGTATFVVAVAPAAARGIVAIFSPDTAERGGRSLLTPEALASVVLGIALVVVWRAYFRELRIGAAASLPFRVGDWLVGYQAGFVRRGLLGLPIVWATDVLHVRPETIVLWIQTALHTLFSFFLFVLARRRRLSIWFLAFLFSPAGLLFPLYDIAVIGRKDVLFFAVLALYAWWMPRSGRWWIYALTFTLGAATTLTHELFFFFTPYLFVMRLLSTKDSDARRLVPEWSLLLGSFVALLLVSTIGADMHGEAQCADLLRRGFDKDLCDGILRYPSTTIAAAQRELVTEIALNHYLIAYPSALLLAALPLLPLFASLRQRPPRTFWYGLLAAFAFTLPMFAIMLDWGRLLNMNVIATAIVILTVVLEDRSTPGSVFGVRNRWLCAVVVLSVSVYLSGWSIRHCCADRVRTGIFTPDWATWPNGIF
jgi:hypothetical protein